MGRRRELRHLRVVVRADLRDGNGHRAELHQCFWSSHSRTFLAEPTALRFDQHLCRRQPRSDDCRDRNFLHHQLTGCPIERRLLRRTCDRIRSPADELLHCRFLCRTCRESPGNFGGRNGRDRGNVVEPLPLRRDSHLCRQQHCRHHLGKRYQLDQRPQPGSGHCPALHRSGSERWHFSPGMSQRSPPRTRRRRGLQDPRQRRQPADQPRHRRHDCSCQHADRQHRGSRRCFSQFRR